MLMVIDPVGQVRCLYSEMLDLARLGALHITRASHLEPDRKGRWWADLGPVGGPRLGPFAQRSQGLAIEQKWLESHRLLHHDGHDPNTTERNTVGLTIHYNLKTHLERVDDVRFALEAMRQAAGKLPFKEVGNVMEFKGRDLSHEDRDDPNRWFKIQAGNYFQYAGAHFGVDPTHIIGFETWPGEGCEPANFGLCRYPATMEVQLGPGYRKTVRTGLTGWRWRSCCKTQYASDPSCGATENFMRCHLLVIQMLDHLARSGWFEVEVKDESGYWEHRDPQKLAQTVGQWNEMIAPVVGQFKDAAGAMGEDIEAPITQYPTYEHLEARGQNQLKKN